ncbi:Putative EamA domain-containing protein [Septoria linicola]|uniref:EamA domain-containing protein n=1 Tax=Septoria linicola TaxID=215465 RepID=A0A9Q9EQA7_9PEZI|nr:Putative EamA domain-containing protein [Septoria linicola]
MSLRPNRDENDKASGLSREDTRENDPVSVAHTLKQNVRQLSFTEGSGYLSAPLSGPIRPLSPDALSVLSAEEFEQISPSRRSSRVSIANNAFGKPQSLRTRLGASWLRNKGLVLMLIAQFFGTLMNVTTRILEVEGNGGKGFHPFQILFVRMGITVILASCYMYYSRTPHFPFGAPEVRWLLIARGFCGFFGVFGMYYSLLYLPLADATVITFLAPGLACWVCSKLIDEPFTRLEKIGTGVSLLGVLFIARPTTLLHAFGSAAHTSASDSAGGSTGSEDADAGNYDDVTPVQRLEGVGVALIGVCGAVGAYTTIRWIGKRAHPLVSVNYFASWCVVVSLVMQLLLPSIGFLFPSGVREWGLLLFLGICGFVMQFLLASALSYEKSSRVTNMIYTQMLFALTFDKLVFGHSPGFLSILGSSLILGSAIVVAFQKSTSESQKQAEDSNLRSDEEAQNHLMADIDGSNNQERLPVEEVQLRTLR